MGHLFLQKDGEHAGQPQQPPTYCGRLIVSKKKAMDSPEKKCSPPAAGLIVSTLPQLEPPPCSPQATGTSKTAPKPCACLPRPTSKRETELALRQQISQAVK